MPKQVAKAEFSTFIKGLITEASPLNFPQNASFDEENFELNRDGTRFRRLGMDYEDNHQNKLSTASQAVLSQNPPTTFKWLNVTGKGSKNFLVVQTGNTLSFYDMAIEPLSNQVADTVVLSFLDTVAYSFATVNGRLIIASGSDTIAVVEYTEGVLSVSYDRLKTRDVWGVEVTDVPRYETDVSYRAAVSSEKHSYNLQNQSWGIPRKDAVGTSKDPSILYSTDLGVFPSNSEVVWTGLQFQAVQSGQVPFERVYTNLYEETLGSELKTAKGYFIIDVLRRGQSRIEKVNENHEKYPIMSLVSPSLPTDLTPGGATVLGEFAGRVFYGGFSGEIIDGDKRSPNLSNLVFFSQLVKSGPDVFKCHQEGDPTSRDSSDVVETDGGFIRISGMNNPLAMINMGTHLVVVADNGVWSVQGGNDYGFSATNYKVDKISTFGGLSYSSVVEFSGRSMYWGQDGIYLIQKDQFGALVVSSVTESTIQTFYEDIDTVAKSKAISCYDAVGKKIRWLYKDGTEFTDSSDQRELVFDLVINAFSKNKIYNSQDNNSEVVSLFSAVQFKNSIEDEIVYIGSDPVLLGVSNSIVTVPDNSLKSAIQATRYLVLSLINGLPYYTFGYYKSRTFQDWASSPSGGTDAFAYLITGQMTGGDSSVAKQVPYLTMHFYRTEDGVDENLIPIHQSGCLVRSQWDWANNANTNKWGPLRETYRYRKAYLASSTSDPYDNGYELVTSKTKLRGRGKAFAMHMETEPLKDCKIVGWNVAFDGNQYT